MINELKVLFNKDFSHQITICTCCKSKSNLIMIDGAVDKINHVICMKCSNEPVLFPDYQLKKSSIL